VAYGSCFWPVAAGYFAIFAAIFVAKADGTEEKRIWRRCGETIGEGQSQTEKKVYTEEDLSGMRGNGVSVVGDEKPAGAGAAGTKKADGKTKTGVVPMSGQGKAHELLDQITATEQQIAKLKDDIKKYGTGGFDVTTGMKSNVAYIEDRNGQVKDLEKRKADLEKKLDQLEEQGRKAEGGSRAGVVPPRARRDGTKMWQRSEAGRDARRHLALESFVQGKRPRPKLTLGPVVFGTAFALS
jgi:hypothetical protein